MIGGEAGVGKTLLVSRFTQEAALGGATVLTGACLEVGAGGIPYAPFVEALRALVRATDPARLPALLGPGRGELSRLLPELAARKAEVPAPEPDATAQNRLFELILGVVERLAAASPVVIVVDDLQWADRPSRDLLGFLIRGLRSARVLTVLTARSEDLAGRSSVLGFVAELERDDNVERLELRRFGRAEVARQVAALTGGEADPRLVDRVFERSDGNPFYAEQLVASVEAGDGGDLPPRLQDILLARIAELSPAAQEVLRAASAAGRRLDDQLLGAAVELTPRQLRERLREVVASGILVPVAGADGQPAYAFRHALLQEVVYRELFAGERVRLHAAFAAALEARGETDSTAVEPAELAYHWDLAREPTKALPTIVAAARAAERVYAYSVALRHFERALELWPRVPNANWIVPGGQVDLIRGAAEAAMLAGDGKRAIEFGRAALNAVDSTADPGRAAVLQERLRWFLWEAGERRAAEEAVRAAERLIPIEPPSAARAGVLAHLAGIELFSGQYAESRDHAREAVRVARVAGAANEQALGLGILGWDEAVLGDVESGVATFQEGQRIAETFGSVEGIALGATNLASLFDRVGRTADALDVALKGFEAMRRLGVERTYGGLLLGYAAKAEFVLGRWDEADQTTAGALGRGAQGRPALWLLINRARLLTGRGRFNEAAEGLSRARSIEEDLGGTEFWSPLLEAIGELGAWQGRPEAVRPAADEGLRRALESGPPDPALAWLAALALRAEADVAEQARSRRDEASVAEARRRGAELMARIRRAIPALEAESGRGAADSQEAFGVTDRARTAALSRLCDAEYERLEGKNLAASWAAVADAWTSAGRPFPTAYARWRQAEAVLEGGGQRADARPALQEAMAIADRLSAQPLATEVGLLARRARINLAGGEAGAEQATLDAGALTVDTTAPYAFTAREQEVLRLVAGGWTNQQIADALFISRKTASVHVSNILGKLGVGSRTEAAAVAHRLGLGRDAPSPPDSVASAGVAGR